MLPVSLWLVFLVTAGPRQVVNERAAARRIAEHLERGVEVEDVAGREPTARAVDREDRVAVDVAAAYLLAHQLGCKGVTVFRYGSKAEPMLELGLGETPEEREHFAKCDPEACRL